VAKLVPLAPVAQKKHLGLLRGAFTIPHDFDAPLPKGLLETFEAK
jgi:antitoxin (DNA-binding transcriptional repressor) of toxin-antitoxin stability system